MIAPPSSGPAATPSPVMPPQMPIAEPRFSAGQPAFAAYQRGRDGRYRAHAVLVLTVTATGIARIVIFLDPGLFGAFGLPAEYAAAAARPARAQDLAVTLWPR